MRTYVFLFFVTIFLLVMLVILLNLLTPFDEVAVMELIRAEDIKAVEELRFVIGEIVAQGLAFEYLNYRNAAIALGVASAAIITGFSLISMIIERVFFLKFYEKVSLSKALRRGSILALMVVGTFLLSLLGTEWYVQIAFIVLMFIVELILGRSFTLKPEILDEYKEDSEIDEESLSLALRITHSSKAFISYISEALRNAYSGTRSRLVKDESELKSEEVTRQEGLIEPETVVLSNNEPID